VTALLDAFRLVIERRGLSDAQAHEAMKELMSGTATPELIGGFLAALRVKGETIEEITGFARAMREASIRIRPRVRGRLIDTCSTGGAAVKTFNLGTTAAFVAAADGVPVAKHGNRSFNRPSGSADLLEALGANLALPPPQVQAVIEEVGIGFLFSPNFHPAMKHAAPARKNLGVRTVFNLLGPICNPAGAQGQVLGVYDAAWVEPLAQALQRLGTEHAIVLHAQGSDEPSLHVPTQVAEVKDGTVRRRELRASELGLPDHTAEEVGPLAPAESARRARHILGGGDGPRAAAVTFNAGLALYVGGHARSVEAGVVRARELLSDRSPLAKLDEFVEATRRTGGPTR
jgi:anthranilate phosphoribosyltransferase